MELIVVLLMVVLFVAAIGVAIVIAFLIGVLVIGLLAWMTQEFVKAMNLEQAQSIAVAEQLGLQWRSRRSFVLPYGEGECSLKLGTTGRDRHRRQHTELSWKLPFVFPSFSLNETQGINLVDMLGGEDVKVGDAAFDRRYRIWIAGGESIAQWVFQDRLRNALEAFRAVAPSDSSNLIVKCSNTGTRKNTTVEVRMPGWMVNISEENPQRERLDALVQTIEEFNTVLEEIALTPWREAAGLGLTLQAQPGAPELVGELDGHPVRVSLSVRGRSWITEIEILVRGPKGLRIVHADRAEPELEPLELDNPLVDRLVSVTAEDTAGAHALFAEQSFIDNVLPIVHGHPHSEVTEEAVRVRVASRLVPNLAELVTHAVKVAECLAKVASPLPKETVDSTAQAAPVEAGHPVAEGR